MKNKTFNFLIIIIAFIILDLIGLLLYAQNNFLNEAEKNDILPKISFPTEPLSTNFVPQKTNPEPNKIILQNIDIMTTIKENSPEEFDGKSWNEIFSTRISAIKQYQKNNKNINTQKKHQQNVSFKNIYVEDITDIGNYREGGSPARFTKKDALFCIFLN